MHEKRSSKGIKIKTENKKSYIDVIYHNFACPNRISAYAEIKYLSVNEIGFYYVFALIDVHCSSFYFETPLFNIIGKILHRERQTHPTKIGFHAFRK